MNRSAVLVLAAAGCSTTTPTEAPPPAERPVALAIVHDVAPLEGVVIRRFSVGDVELVEIHVASRRPIGWTGVVAVTRSHGGSFSARMRARDSESVPDRWTYVIDLSRFAPDEPLPEVAVGETVELVPIGPLPGGIDPPRRGIIDYVPGRR
jgi:hypothetical protein